MKTIVLGQPRPADPMADFGRVRTTVRFGKAARIGVAALTLVGLLPGCQLAQTGPAILEPEKAAPAGPRYAAVRPDPQNQDHFVARTKHLLELVRKHPAAAGDPWFRIGGAQFWPASPITAAALKILDAERGDFSRAQRDRALECAKPRALPPDTQVLSLQARGSRLAMPVFLTPEGQELHYLELSLDRPGAPVLLVITGYNALAVRITTSPATRLAAVHLHTYYPNVVLGVDPDKVTQQYYGLGRNRACSYGFSDAVRSAAVIRQLGYDPDKAVRYDTRERDRVAIGRPQAVKRAPPTLGRFLDPEMPVPNNYGIVVLANLGYIRPVSRKEAPARGMEAFEVLKPFRIPAGLAGSHSVTFVLAPDAPIPSGDLAHSSMLRRIR